MSAYTPEQDELLTVIETAHRESWDDATEYSDAPHIIRAAVVRWLAEHDRQVKAEAWDKGFDAGELDVFQHFTKDTWDEPHACLQNPYRNAEAGE